jgi:hypothetical protein
VLVAAGDGEAAGVFARTVGVEAAGVRVRDAFPFSLGYETR